MGAKPKQATAGRAVSVIRLSDKKGTFQNIQARGGAEVAAFYQSYGAMGGCLSLGGSKM